MCAPAGSLRSSSNRRERSADCSVSCVPDHLTFLLVVDSRVMSRTAAAGKRNRKTGVVISEGRVTPAMLEGWMKEKEVILRGGGLDECPHAYS